MARRDTLDSAMALASGLEDAGFHVSIERAGEATDDVAAERALLDCLDLVGRLEGGAVLPTAEVVVGPAALGAHAGIATAFARLSFVADRAASAGVPLLVETEPDVERTLAWAEPRLPGIGLVLSASLRRTEADCARLAGTRIRLARGARGARRDGGGRAFAQWIEVDKAYVRCAKRLLQGSGRPSFATDDRRLVEIVEDLSVRFHREEVEFALPLGRGEAQQQRLLAVGARVRVRVPYGQQWLERLVAGWDDQPGSLAAAVRSVLPG